MALTGKQRRFLRAAGHHLSAVLQIGKEGVSEQFAAAADSALADHELIKVRIGKNALVEGKEARVETAHELARATGSEVVQVLGSTVLLYRPDPDEPRIALP